VKLRDHAVRILTGRRPDAPVEAVGVREAADADLEMAGDER
jgi:hypothetical protein